MSSPWYPPQHGGISICPYPPQKPYPMAKKPTPPTYPPQQGALKFTELPDGSVGVQAFLAPPRPKGAPSTVQDLLFAVLDGLAELKASLAKSAKKTPTPAPKKGAKRAPNKKRR